MDALKIYSKNVVVVKKKYAIAKVNKKFVININIVVATIYQNVLVNSRDIVVINIVNVYQQIFYCTNVYTK